MTFIKAYFFILFFLLSLNQLIKCVQTREIVCMSSFQNQAPLDSYTKILSADWNYAASSWLLTPGNEMKFVALIWRSRGLFIPSFLQNTSVHTHSNSITALKQSLRHTCQKRLPWFVYGNDQSWTCLSSTQHVILHVWHWHWIQMSKYLLV